MNLQPQPKTRIYPQIMKIKMNLNFLITGNTVENRFHKSFGVRPVCLAIRDNM
jgi:hypothetical protein